MPDQEIETIWREIAALVNTLPPDERRRYNAAIRRWVHDLGHYIGLIRTSEGLIRREAQEGKGVDMELLDIVQNATQHLVAMLAEIRTLGDTIDDGK